MKTVLITGAAGFIGFHLARALCERGDKVIGYDNFNSYYDPKLKKDRAKELSKLGISVIEGDICHSQELQTVVENSGITHLVHLAAQAGVRYSIENPQAYMTANIEGFLNILEVCRKNSSIKLTYASSSSVYGLNETIPFSVSDRTDQQASFYGVTKKSNELMARTYSHLYDVHATGLRFFTVYGPWGRPDMAYFSFTKAILEGKPIELFNQGHMQRDFTYIDDIIEGTIAAIDKGYRCEVFNLGNHRPEPLLELVSCLEKAIGKEAIKHFKPMQPGDVVSTYADIKESTDKLGFFPETSLQEGIFHFIDWYYKYFLNK